MVEDAAYMQDFSFCYVVGARLVGAYNSGRGDRSDQVFQNVIRNSYFVHCGSGAARQPAAFLKAEYSGRAAAGADTGGGGQGDQLTIVTVNVLPPALALEPYTIPIFAEIDGNLHQVRAIDGRNSKISLFPWLPNASRSGSLRYIFGAGLMSAAGDAGMLRAKVASTHCAIGVHNWATYGGEIQGTFQFCAVGFMNGQWSVPTIGPEYNGYFEGNSFDFVDSSGSGYFTLEAEQALDAGKTLKIIARNSDRAKSLVSHVKMPGLMNIGGYWHHPELAPDFSEGLDFARVSLDRHNHVMLPLAGDDADIRIDAQSAATFNRLFGYRARTLQVVGTAASGAPTRITVRLEYYQTIPAGAHVKDRGRRINGGALGADAVFTGFTGPVLMQISLDPADATNIRVVFFAGKGA
jgi:hypothetical protein